MTFCWQQRAVSYCWMYEPDLKSVTCAYGADICSVPLSALFLTDSLWLVRSSEAFWGFVNECAACKFSVYDVWRCILWGWFDTKKLKSAGVLTDP